jgi:serine/threonine protein phosphatase PrpC
VILRAYPVFLFAVKGTKAFLDVANLGDSGVVVLRNASTVMATVPQQHMFNMPYQLYYDMPDKADIYSLYAPPAHALCNAVVQCICAILLTQCSELEENDIVIAATDGVFDNLFPADVETLMSRFNDAPVTTIAEKIASEAVYYANSSRDSPFALGSGRFHGGMHSRCAHSVHS